MLVNEIDKVKKRVNTALQEYINNLPNLDIELKNALEYALLLGGKRIRPFLVYSIGNMLGVDVKTLDPLACAIECIHSYSLVHDDLPAMDDDAMRRGHNTVHIEFSEATAIIAGDTLQTLAFEILSQPIPNISAETQLKMINVLAKASGYLGMCGGQAIDLESTNKDISLERLEMLHSLKTGALIEASAKLALLASNKVNLEQQDSILAYAKAIGLAFQVQDDILDVVGDTLVLGKQSGADENANKSTYPKLLGLDETKLKALKLKDKAISELKKLPYTHELLQEFAQYVIDRKL